jgi:hypothetical protein
MGKFSDDLSRRFRKRPEDKKLAREATDRDREQYFNKLAEAAAIGPGTIQFGPPYEGTPDLISIEIGARDNLTPTAAEKWGGQWREFVAQQPKAYFIPSIAGYDDDPRALWDFPEVCEYMKRWAAAAGINSIDDLPNVSQDTVRLFAACGLFGSDMEAEARSGSQTTEH